MWLSGNLHIGSQTRSEIFDRTLDVKFMVSLTVRKHFGYTHVVGTAEEAFEGRGVGF